MMNEEKFLAEIENIEGRLRVLKEALNNKQHTIPYTDLKHGDKFKFSADSERLGSEGKTYVALVPHQNLAITKIEDRSSTYFMAFTPARKGTHFYIFHEDDRVIKCEES